MPEANGLESFARSLGVDLFGAADLRRFRPYDGFDADLIRKFSFGVSIAIRLSSSVIDGITEEDPTQSYAHHYLTANTLLDGLTLRISNYCQRKGYAALPVPASQILRGNTHLGMISHKAVATLAGLGWIGKSQLLINPSLGPRLRLGTVLTEMPLKTAHPVEGRCGSCIECSKACPVGAISGKNVGDKPWIREDVFNPDSCWKRLSVFRSDPHLAVSICGLCVKACPYGKRSTL